MVWYFDEDDVRIPINPPEGLKLEWLQVANQRLLVVRIPINPPEGLKLPAG
jgi:hypothetical protein